MTYLEKILSYCALANNIEQSWKRQKILAEKYPLLIEAAPIYIALFPSLILAGLSILGEFSFPQLLLMWPMGMCVFGAALFGWDAFKRHETRKKLGYSLGAIEAAPNEKQIHVILEKMLRLPSTPQTQELKNQLWTLADKNLLPQCWWMDVEKELDAWIASNERNVLKTKLLNPENLETVNVKQEDGAQTSTIASPQRIVV